MATSKSERQERQEIINLIGVQWIGKNSLRLKTDPNIAFQKLLDNGFTSSRIPFCSVKPIYGISFEITRNKFSWFIYIDIRDFLKSVSILFKFIDSLNENGYSGSNEWKYDACKKIGISMLGDLAYLDQPGKYWFNNELKER